MTTPMKSIKKRLIPFTTAILATTILLAGCGQSGAAQNETAVAYTKGDKVVEVQFWTSAMEKVNQELVDEFNKTKGAELNIHVNAEYQGDYWETQKKINAAAIANTLPNVFIDEVAMTKGFADNDTIVDLEPYMKASDFDREDFKIGDLGNLYVGEDMYAFPHMRSLPVMYINKTLAKKVGMDEKGPQTFAELESYLKASYDATGKTPMYLFNNDFWVMEALLYSYSNTTILNEDETAANINSKGAVDLITYLNDLISKGYIKVLSATQQNDFIGAVSSPDTLLTFSSIGGYKIFLGLAAKTKTELGVAMIPAGEGGTRGVSVGGSNVYLANTGTDIEKAAAFEFMKWITDTDQAAYASVNTGYLPTRLSSLDTDIMKNTIAQLPGYQVAIDELKFSKMRPKNGVYHEVENLLVTRISDIWTDKLNIQESLDALKKDVDAILTR
ncbi:ABC transporter substrate-binding protein [Paenibacillus radicis (ex Gao et al. 2016)]|uniref:ABC transporter substrate-binding protein n=1 Tax=Paenibacillus radicis (ex Gao et al. 2016) TaxID=1737354 RepID=A0A917LVS7_9BACL|nr:ABC transporter substrate-binding protein [Paenibacillus radicis (ex Gao et al. 2016)]GGG60189.1 ABC transporter substrate-binding protein [Paenibacillus radicis (ex Gao et al. 2016)]